LPWTSLNLNPTKPTCAPADGLREGELTFGSDIGLFLENDVSVKLQIVRIRIKRFVSR
jgi:hypothetical protein